MRGRFIGMMLATIAMTPAPAPAFDYYQWQQGQPWVDMGDSASQYCFVQSVQGRFSGHGELVRLYDTGGRWRLYGKGQSSGVAIAARCMTRSEFGKPQDAHMASETFFLSRTTSGKTKCFSATTPTWWGDAWTAITAIGGRLRGAGEYVATSQANGGKIPSSVEVHSCQDDTQIDAEAHSFFVGTPQSGKFAQFWGPQAGGFGPAAVVGEYVVGANQSVQMAEVGKSYCFFSQIGGDFQSYQDGVEILNGENKYGTGRWLLRARSTSPGGTLAKARCIFRHKAS